MHDKESKQLNILLITYAFSESSLAASYRVSKLAKYLIRQGHQVVVVSASRSEKDESDFGLMGGKQIYIPAYFLNSSNFLSKFLMRLIALPDPSILWARKTYREIESDFNKYKIDVILTSSPPHGIQYLGVLLAERFCVPYVADFRDDFLTNHRVKWRTPLHRWAAEKLEKRVLETARLVITNTQVIQNRFQDRYPQYKSKIITVSNGYDEDDFNGLGGERHIGTRSRIVYLGGDYNGFSPKIISDIAAQLIRLGLSNDWAIHTAGSGNWEDSVKNYDFWIHHGLLSQRDTNELMDTADILVLLMPPGEREPSGTVPLKTYSYLRSGKSIVYFGERGSVTDLLALFQGTFSLSRESVVTFGEWLIKEQANIKGMVYERKAIIDRYSFAELTKEIMLAVEMSLKNEQNG